MTCVVRRDGVVWAWHCPDCVNQPGRTLYPIEAAAMADAEEHDRVWHPPVDWDAWQDPSGVGIAGLAATATAPEGLADSYGDAPEEEDHD